MSFKNYKLAGAIAVVLGFLTACGPVKFSSSSEATVDPTNVNPTPTVTVTPTGTPTATPTPTGPPTLRDVHYSKKIEAATYKLDIVLVVDDSNSMLADNQKLAAKLSNFVSKLQNSNIDWQMCATVTRQMKHPIRWTSV